MTTHRTTTAGRARPVAGALAIAVGTLSVLAGVTAAPAQAAPVTVADGHLDWGVKESFRNYIRGPIAHGSVTTTDGATENPDGTFRFTAATGSVDADTDDGELAFAGTVTFSGHDSGSGPQLYLSISQVRVQLAGGAGALVADVVSKSLQSGELTSYDDVEFAALAGADLVGTDSTVTAGGIGAALTEDGVPAFADFYPAGTELDPVSFAVTVAPPAQWEPAIEVSRTSGLDPDGETVTVGGAGFDPAANVGTRPPLAGQPTGVYLVFARITEPWRPSEGAPASARTVLAQKWVLPAESRSVLDPGGTNPDFVTLAADGTFSANLPVRQVTEGENGTVDCEVDTCAVLTYAAGGAVNADHELAVPLSFGTDPTTSPISTTSQPTTSTGTSTSPAGTVTDARLEWGVKESFRSYVRGPIAGGKWTLTGVTDNGGTGPFRWEQLASGSLDADGRDGRLAFTGSVRFTGHDQGSGPLLDLAISRPQLRVTGDTATLLLDVRSKGLENPGQVVELTGAEFAELDLATAQRTVRDGVITYAGAPATLTADGAGGFAGFYDAGTALDPVTFSVALDGATLPDPSPGGGAPSPAPGGLASTGTTLWPLTALGAALVVAGAGLLVAHRRRARFG